MNDSGQRTRFIGPFGHVDRAAYRLSDPSINSVEIHQRTVTVALTNRPSALAFAGS